ncbi:MAG: hypothetical protein IRZ08_08015 [Frankia sp.]|nr:hypothetical protein [Frankia sp.]
MPQLPRVAVLGPDLAGAIALAALVDCGLDATGIGGEPTPRAAALLSGNALTARWLAGPELAAAAVRLVPPPDAPAVAGGTDQIGGPAPASEAGGGGGGGMAAGGGEAREPTIGLRRVEPEQGTHQGFEVLVSGRPVGVFDAVVVTGSAASAASELAGSAIPWFGGVFHPRADGVYLVGWLPDGSAAEPEVAEAQASWVGEYLRGRYLLPSYHEMASRPALRRLPFGRQRGRGYLRALERERRAGRARATAAGYPLPLPAARR